MENTHSENLQVINMKGCRLQGDNLGKRAERFFHFDRLYSLLYLILLIAGIKILGEGALLLVGSTLGTTMEKITSFFRKPPT